LAHRLQEMVLRLKRGPSKHKHGSTVESTDDERFSNRFGARFFRKPTTAKRVGPETLEGDEPIDPIGEFLAKTSAGITGGQPALEARSGSLRDDIFKLAARKGCLDSPDATDLLNFAKICKGAAKPAKPGVKTRRTTFEMIQGIAWLAVKEPKLEGRKLAVRMGIDQAKLDRFRKKHKRQINAAIELLQLPKLPH
jgi:hypothetical protein